jgi:hypothetical protein
MALPLSDWRQRTAAWALLIRRIAEVVAFVTVDAVGDALATLVGIAGEVIEQSRHRRGQCVTK